MGRFSGWRPGSSCRAPGDRRRTPRRASARGRRRSARVPRSTPARTRGAAHQQRHVLARVIGARRRRVVAVVGREHQQVVRPAVAAAAPTAARRTARGSPRSPRRCCGARRPCRSPRGSRRSGPRPVWSSARSTSSIPSSSDVVWTAPVMPWPANRSTILPMANTGMPAAFRRSSSVSPAGGIAKSWRFDVRWNAPGAPTNGRAMIAAEADALHEHLVGDLALPVQFGDGDDVLVRGDLEHAVGRRVDDRRPGPHVLGPEFLDDHRARGHGVARASCGRCAARTRGSSPRESRSGNTGNGRSSDEPHQLPVAGDRVLARRPLGHPAERRGRRGHRRAAREVGRCATGRGRAASGICSGTRARDVAAACGCPGRRSPAASGSSPTPTLSSTMTMTRENGLAHWAWWL